MKRQSDKKKPVNDIKLPSTLPNDSQPENAFEQVNFYGTYNIQPTSCSDNTYPAIAQGLDKKEVQKLADEAERWLKEDKKNPQRPGN